MCYLSQYNFYAAFLNCLPYWTQKNPEYFLENVYNGSTSYTNNL